MSKKRVYTNPLKHLGHGGGKIKRKWIFAVLIFLALTLPLNAGTISAVSQNQTNATDKVQSTTEQVNTDSNYKTTDSTEKLTTTNSTATTSTTSKSSATSKNTSSSNNDSQKTAGSAAGSTTTIKVLIYNGAYASANCVNGLKTVLTNANSNNLVSGVKYTYATTTKITSSTLSGYNILIMPGGDGGSLYLNSGSISASAIKSFVANGGGYMGICAGAYAAVARVDGRYNGWGIAPHVNAKAVSYVGNLAMQFTSAGTQLLDRSGNINVYHYNGAAMYTTSNTAKILATYADSKTGYKSYADIVSDYYGKGRSVLLGSHLELSPQYPDILAKLIAWAADVSTESSTPTTTVSVSQVASAASSVKSFVEGNQRLPNYVTISGKQVTMPEFLSLLTTGTIQLNSGSTAAITVKDVDSALNSSGNVKSGNILKSEYLKIAQSIQNFMSSNGRAPNYATTTLGKISYDSLTYTFSKILNFYSINHRLPNYVSIAKNSASNSSSSEGSPSSSNGSLSSNSSTTQTVTLSQINSAASSVKSFVEGNQRLPNYVTISGKQVTMPEFLSLLTTGTIQLNSGSTAAITVKDVDSAPNSTENVKSGNILKSEYLKIAQSIQNFMSSNGRAPNYATTTLGKISYDSLTYTFSKVLNFYSTNNRLPNYVSVSPWKGNSTGSASQSEGGSSTGVLRPVCIVSDIIYNSVKDNALINSIVSALSNLGVKAYNYGVGSQAHLTVLSNKNVPENALIVEIGGGADAGVIYEKGTKWYKNLLGADRKDFIVFYNTATKITGLTWLPRAHDDNYSSSSFKGIANPDKYLINNGYNYFEGLTTSNISALVQILYKEATS